MPDQANPGEPKQVLTLGRFRVVRTLGEGAMGEVFAAEDPSLNRTVAIKVLSDSLANTPEFRERFRREAVAMAQVDHPNVLQVYELGEHAGRPFFAMELLEGGDAEQALSEGPPPVEQGARWILEAALGLGAAAERGLVHRDVKPANLMLHRGHVKVADFGLARILAPDAALTQFGAVMGTPDYMAPEQALGTPVDSRADIYALGLTAFHIFTGSVPFTAEGYVEVLKAQLGTPCPDPRVLRPDLPEPLAALILRMADKRPEARPQNYDEVAAALAPFTGQASLTAGPPNSLRFSAGPMAGRRVMLPLGESFVGRLPECLIVLDDTQVSRRHAALVRTPSGLSVRDLGSRNGVLVNGARMPQAELAVGDQLRIGDATFTVESAAERNAQLSLSGPRIEALAATGRTALLRELALAVALGRTAPLEKLEEIPRAPLWPVRRLAVVRLRDGKPETLFHAVRAEADRLPPFEPALQLALTSATTLYSADVRRDPRFAALASPVATVVAAPLLSPRGPYGVLYADALEPQALSPEELAAFEAAAHLLAALLAPR